MVVIVVRAEDVAPGAVVVGYSISVMRPTTRQLYACEPTPLTRLYSGYGKMRAETGTHKGKGFGRLIGGPSGAEITSCEVSSGKRLWLAVQD